MAECVRGDLKGGLNKEMTQDNDLWRRHRIHGNRPTCASTENGC
jgi:hypothetical protein